MKTIRNLATLIGLSIALFALATTGAKAQDLEVTLLGGSFTLPFEAHWGGMTLPPGNYNIYYGHMNASGAYVVEIEGTAKDSPHGFVQVQSHNPTLLAKSAIVCIREGRIGVVEALQMPAIGETVFFAAPRGVTLMAHKANGRTNTLLADAPNLYQRIPVTMNGK